MSCDLIQCVHYKEEKKNNCNHFENIKDCHVLNDYNYDPSDSYGV